MLKTIVTQPLLHFILLGFALFPLYYYINGQSQAQQISSVVVVTEGDLLKFIQERSANTNAADVRQQLESMTLEEREAIVDDYLIQEIYYREAEFLGLGEDNFTIKREMAKEYEDLIRAGFEKVAGDRTGDDRDTFIRESMANAAGQIKKTYGIDIRLDGFWGRDDVEGLLPEPAQ